MVIDPGIFRFQFRMVEQFNILSIRFRVCRWQIHFWSAIIILLDTIFEQVVVNIFSYSLFQNLISSTEFVRKRHKYYVVILVNEGKINMMALQYALSLKQSKISNPQIPIFWVTCQCESTMLKNTVILCYTRTRRKNINYRWSGVVCVIYNEPTCASNNRGVRCNVIGVALWVTSLHQTLCADPDNKGHGANMGPTWVLSAPDGPHVGPMNLAICGPVWYFHISVPYVVCRSVWQPWYW